MSLLPTVPTPQMNRLSTLYSERKNESWITLSDLRRYLPGMTNEMLVSNAPCAMVMMLTPLRPRVLNSLPAMPGRWRIFSPTMATVASPLSAIMGYMAPVAISLANSSLSTCTASLASVSLTAIEVEFSDEAWLTMNTLMPLSARAVKIRLLTPMTPTIDNPVTVMSVVWSMLDIPLMMRLSCSTLRMMTVPGAWALKVFFTLMGMFFTHTG